jgi:beta-alanine--pyruvate transaminase
MAPYFEEAAHALKGLPYVKDVRNLGLICGIELESVPGKATVRAFDVFLKCFWDKNVLIRTTGDIIALSPPLIIDKSQVDELFSSIADVLKNQKAIPEIAAVTV